MIPRLHLIDTNILINAIRQKKGRLELLRDLVENGGALGCSVVTVGEIYAGMRSHEKTRTEDLLRGFEEFEVTGEIARQAGTLKNQAAAGGFILALPDMIIGATALVHKLVLVTENRKDFALPGLLLYNLAAHD